MSVLLFGIIEAVNPRFDQTELELFVKKDIWYESVLVPKQKTAAWQQHYED